MACVKLNRIIGRAKYVFRIRVLLFLSLLLSLIVIVKIAVSNEENKENEDYRPEKQKKTRFRLLTDERVFSNDVLLEESQNLAPNLPVLFWKKVRNSQLRFNATCALFPNLLKLRFNNLYWQSLQIPNATVHVFGAYKDVRNGNPLGPSVRILAMMHQNTPTPNLHCQLWFQNQTLLSPVVDIKFITIIKYHTDITNDPYLLTCKIPPQLHNATLGAVSIVHNPCETATNLLKVIYNPAKSKKDFAVCVKGLSFSEDISTRLVEWIELLKLLGADKIFFYKLKVHPNTAKVLEYYEDRGMVETTPVTLVGESPNLPFLQQLFLSTHVTRQRKDELVPYHDCFYRHMYQYKFILLLDTDEVIVPLRNSSWGDLLKTLIKKTAKLEDKAAFFARNVYFFDKYVKKGEFADIPPYLHMLQHVRRAKNLTSPGAYIKSFFNTDNVVVLHNHYPKDCFKNCSIKLIDIKDAQLQHYRSKCPRELKCDEFKDHMLDTNLWRFKEQIVERVTKTLRDLELLVPET